MIFRTIKIQWCDIKKPFFDNLASVLDSYQTLVIKKTFREVAGRQVYLNNSLMVSRGLLAE